MCYRLMLSLSLFVFGPCCFLEQVYRRLPHHDCYCTTATPAAMLLLLLLLQLQQQQLLPLLLLLLVLALVSTTRTTSTTSTSSSSSSTTTTTTTTTTTAIHTMTTTTTTATTTSKVLGRSPSNHRCPCALAVAPPRASLMEPSRRSFLKESTWLQGSSLPASFRG